MAPRFDPSLENELGTPGQGAASSWLDQAEDAPALRWPQSVATYDKMRKAGQVASTLRAYGHPIRRANWRLAGDDVRQVVLDLCVDELGLQPRGRGRQRRRREGVVFDEVLTAALRYLPFGHAYFEQVYQVGPPAPGLEELGEVAHLRKLAERPQRTISGFVVAEDGGLQGIKQHVPRRVNAAGAAYTEEVTIPVDRLVAFVNEREGADWAGTSLLRAAYTDWLIADKLRRFGPVAVERNGMGLPVVTYAQAKDRAKALALARAVRMGADAGVALPADMTLSLVGVTGQVRDELPLLKYLDEGIGRSVLAMFLNLGHDDGARSLGDTFVGVFAQAGDACANYVGEVCTEHVVRDLVELNFGPDEPYPELVHDEITGDSPATAQAMRELITAGVITPDDPLEAYTRSRFRLPAADPTSARHPAPPATVEPEVDADGNPIEAPADRPGLPGGRPPAPSGRQDRRPGVPTPVPSVGGGGPVQRPSRPLQTAASAALDQVGLDELEARVRAAEAGIAARRSAVAAR